MNQPEQRPTPWEHLQLAPNLQERAVFNELVTFCRTHGGRRCFAGWPDRLLREYLLFHLRQHTLVYVRPGMALKDKYALRPILGVMFAWPEYEATIEECTEKQECVFAWQVPHHHEDGIYVAEVIAAPGREPSRRQIVQTMARTLWVRWPQHRGKRVWYHREVQGRWESKRFDSRLLGWAGLPQEKEEMVYG